MFLPEVRMERRAWGKRIFYMATVGHCQVFPHISDVAWDGKDVWLHICDLATTEEHSRALECGVLNTLVWYAGFMHNGARWLHLSPGKHSLLAFIANPSVLTGLLPVYAADWVGTSPYTSGAAFTSITHSWSSIGAPQRTRSLNQLFTTSTSPQFGSIPFKSDFTDPTEKYFSNEIHGTLVRKHHPIIQNRRGNLILLTSPHTTEFFFFFRKQQVLILINDRNNGNIWWQ